MKPNLFNFTLLRSFLYSNASTMTKIFFMNYGTDVIRQQKPKKFTLEIENNFDLKFMKYFKQFFCTFANFPKLLVSCIVIFTFTVLG